VGGGSLVAESWYDVAEGFRRDTIVAKRDDNDSVRDRVVQIEGDFFVARSRRPQRSRHSTRRMRGALDDSPRKL